ncbi:MAG: hypothetical protein HY286_11345 [Planctomycetes bacterium]|nr:hypothetical protein [Planctomycetota bacterium]
MKRLGFFALLLIVGLLILYALSDDARNLTTSRGGFRRESSPAFRDKSATPLNSILPGKASVTGMSLTPIEDFSIWLLKKSRDPYIHITSPLLRFGRDGSGTMESARISFLGKNSGAQAPVEISAAQIHSAFGGNPPRPLAGPMDATDATIIFRGGKSSNPTIITTRIAALRLTFRGDHDNLEPRDFNSKESFVMTGDGIRGSGTGVDGDALTEIVKIHENPFFELTGGKLSSSGNRIILKSRGETTIESHRDWLSEFTVIFNNQADFRLEKPGQSGFLELNSNQLAAQLREESPADGAENTLKIREITSNTIVSFRTEFIEGRGTSMIVKTPSGDMVDELALQGPYVLDINSAKSSRTIPGFGSPANSVIEGGKTFFVKALSRDPARKDFYMKALGRPKITLKDRETGKVSVISAGMIEAWMSDEQIDSFKATGNVIIESEMGHGVGDVLDVTEIRQNPIVTLTSSTTATLNLNGASAGSGTSQRDISGRKIVFTPSGRDSSLVVASGDVHGSFHENDARRLFFNCAKLEATIIKNSVESATLSGSVDAVSESPQSSARLLGSKLKLDFNNSQPAKSENRTSLPRSAVLTGSPAVIEDLGAESGKRRVLYSPEVTFENDKVSMIGPVEISLPSRSVFGQSLTSSGADSGGDSQMWIGGSHLDTWFDADGKQTRARLLGPFSSRGEMEMEGRELVLNFITGEHYLIADEGKRVSVKSAGRKINSRFLLEASRIDFNTSNESVVLTNDGLVEIQQVGFAFGNSSAGEPLAMTGRNRIRVSSKGRVELNRSSASFRDNVVAEGLDPAGTRLWKTDSQVLTVAFDSAREVRSVRNSGDVHFDVPGRLSGNCDELYTEKSNDFFELKSESPRETYLDLGKLKYRGPWLRLNTRTYLVETGPSVISTSAKSKSH